MKRLILCAAVVLLRVGQAYAVVFTGLGALDVGDNSYLAHAVSADGSVVVEYSRSELGGEEAFRWTGSVIEGMGQPTCGCQPGLSARI